MSTAEVCCRSCGAGNLELVLFPGSTTPATSLVVSQDEGPERRYPPLTARRRKGAPLLNTFGIGTETLDLVADQSTRKQGRFRPGVRFPIFGPERFVEAMPDYTLLLTWNFADEILQQEAEHRRRGGKFIVPVPDVRVV